MFFVLSFTGICAQHGGDQFLPHLPMVLQRLSAMINDPESRSKDNAVATENAISAVGKIIEFHPNSINLGQVIFLFLSFFLVFVYFILFLFHKRCCSDEKRECELYFFSQIT